MARTPDIRRLAAAATLGGFTVLALAVPASAKPYWGPAPTTDGSDIVVREVAVDDGALEPWQIGFGVLGGAGLVGAGMTAANLRQRQHQPRPA